MMFLSLTKIQSNYYRTNFLFRKNYEKHRGGALRQGARSPRERCLACLTTSLAFANIVTFGSTRCQRTRHFSTIERKVQYNLRKTSVKVKESVSKSKAVLFDD